MTQLTTTQRVNEYIQWLMSGTCYLGSDIEDTAFGLSNKTLMKYLEMTTEYKEAKAELAEQLNQFNGYDISCYLLRVPATNIRCDHALEDAVNWLQACVCGRMCRQAKVDIIKASNLCDTLTRIMAIYNDTYLPTARRIDALEQLIIPAMEDKLFTKRGLEVPTL